MLHRRRRRLEDLAKAEAEGQSFWRTDFPIEVRTKVLQASHICLKQQMAAIHYLYRTARQLILHDEGWMVLGYSQGDVDDFQEMLLDVYDGHGLFPSAVEALYLAMDNVYNHVWPDRDTFVECVNIAFREHRISWELIEGHMVEFESKELHEAVVAPTLRLLSGRSEWEFVETAYLNALGELADGKADNAITDAGTALQEALAVLGCDGEQLKPLLKSARAKGIVGPYDERMTAAIIQVGDWVAAERSQRGDTHKAESLASPEDAWFMVHVVGALILRLASGGPRAV